MSEWKLIKSAPRDGTEIILYKDGWQSFPLAKWFYFEEADGFWAWYIFDELRCYGICENILGFQEDVEDGYMPTHWMEKPTHDK